MFTIKHIRLSGDEDIYQSATVTYQPKTTSNTTTDGDQPAKIILDLGEPLTGGTVFIMNEAGKTVSRYDIGASMVPL